MLGFKFIAYGTLLFFMGLLVLVSFTAYTRKSGNTGLDMAKIHLLRAKAPSE